jgi:RNA polymerase sigma factor (TIGR02999 family)
MAFNGRLWQEGLCTMAPPETPLTQLLVAAGAGESSAHEKLWSAVYDELHRLASQQMAAEAAGRTLQPTALVHEAYLRLIGDGDASWASRRHFFAAAAKAMRRIRLDDARRRNRLKRGGGRQREPLGDRPALFDDDPADVLAVDEALRRLEQMDPRKTEVVNLRYFAGLTVDETAQAMGLGPRTVDKEWRLARAWLYRELTRGDTTADSGG